MKVDVEGAELQILAGALRLLRSGRIRNIAVDIHNEILTQQGLKGSEVMDILRSCGYRLNSDLGNWVFEHSGEHRGAAGVDRACQARRSEPNGCPCSL